MKKLLLLFTLLVGISLHCAAQNYTEVVYLKTEVSSAVLSLSKYPTVR